MRAAAWSRSRNYATALPNPLSCSYLLTFDSQLLTPRMSTPTANYPWYSGITGYQWLVLTIASLGWIFDVFEGQVFVASMNEAMPSLLPTGTAEAISKLYNNIALGAFLAGGALGGVIFGALGDRIGRARTMVITILMYS